MKTQLTRNGRKSLLHGALLAVIAYGALVLNSEPAYAAICTIFTCGTDYMTCKSLCSQRGGVVNFYCPFSPTTYLCMCKQGDFQRPC
jgi:hypothetical protein